MQSRVRYTGNANSRLFAVPFPYLAKAHVRVYLNNLPLATPIDYRWIGDATIELTADAPQDIPVDLVRCTTDTEALVLFQNGSVLTESELNTAILQMFYLIQEMRDAYNFAFTGGTARFTPGNGPIGDEAQDVLDRLVEDVLNSTLLADLQARIADIDYNAQNLVDQTLRINNLEDLVLALANIDGQSIAAFLLSEQLARIEGDTALAQTISLIGAKSGDSLSFILDMDKVKVSPTESMGSRLSAIQSSLAGNLAAINTEQTTRATADTAMAQQISTLFANVGTNAAAVVTEATARATADSAMAQQISTLVASVGANASAILTEQTTRANADGALTTSINAVLASTNANAAAIVTEQTARTNADSAFASSMTTLQATVAGHTSSIQTVQTVQGGLTAQWMLKTDVNGYCAGFGLYNNGATSEFIILADRFAVVTPGKNPTVPFVVGNVAGTPVVGINGALIVDGTIYARSMQVGTLSAITANMGTLTAGKITLDGAGKALILEGGSTYPLWFGTGTTPDEANAYFYCKNNGDVYFRGMLRGSNFDMRSTVINTGGGREAPFLIYDCANAGSSTGQTTLYLNYATLYSPDYGTGFHGARFASRLMDVYLFANASGAGSSGQTTNIHFEAQYDGGAWERFATNVFDVGNNASESLSMRYTTKDNNWTYLKFRVIAGGMCHAVSGYIQVFNFAPSHYVGGSTSNPDTGEPGGAGGTGGGGAGGGTGGGGGWCVVSRSFLSPTRQAESAYPGDTYRTFSPSEGIIRRPIEAVGGHVRVPCVRITTTSGAQLECSTTTPFNLKTATGDLQDGQWKHAPDMTNEEVLVEAEDFIGWERVVLVEDIGEQWVTPISFGGHSFAAGVRADRLIYSHNMAKPSGSP